LISPEIPPREGGMFFLDYFLSFDAKILKGFVAGYSSFCICWLL
jgi:hypothetical protein